MSPLDGEAREQLLRLARAAIRSALGAGAAPAADGAAGLAPALLVKCAAFVTLKGPPSAAGIRPLRGCIGSAVARLPLYRAVIEVAPKAALEDPRFPPLTVDDLARVTIEISVLGPLSKLEDARAIEIGRHGVLLGRGPSSALFLPQVAVEHGWDAARLLGQLARKAGLPAAGWKEAELSVFEAQIFGEAEPGC
jgi:AmmeMemoRadiSam system protein A